MTSICVFCGARTGYSPAYAEAAEELGRLLAERNVTTVFGGGQVGLMGRLADAALKHGGQVIGVIPRHLARKELLHPRVDSMYVVKDMRERKKTMEMLADAFIALPGGLGTFEELFEAITGVQLHCHSKPIGLLNTEHYFEPLLKLIDHAVHQGFIRPEHQRLFVVAERPEDLLQQLLTQTKKQKLSSP